MDIVITLEFLADSKDGKTTEYKTSALTKAILITDDGEAEEDPAWTYRYLFPTSVAIATIVILGNVIQYFSQVTRKRYKVIEKQE